MTNIAIAIATATAAEFAVPFLWWARGTRSVFSQPVELAVSDKDSTHDCMIERIAPFDYRIASIGGPTSARTPLREMPDGTIIDKGLPLMENSLCMLPGDQLRLWEEMHYLDHGFWQVHNRTSPTLNFLRLCGAIKSE